MRLQLILVGCLAGSARAEPEPGATAGLHVYADDDHVTVVSPQASVRAEVTPRLAVSADTAVDVISAASVDVVTSASPAEVHEQRVELGLAGTYRQGRATWWTLGIRGSHEHDYDAWRARAGAKTELAQRNTTLQLDYVLGYDRATSASDPSFADHRSSHEVVMTASQLANQRVVVDLVADVTRAVGYHASPYREVVLDMPGSPIGMRVPEVMPRLRSSLALAARVRYALTARWAASALVRIYDDSWDVASLAGTGEVHRRAGGWLIGATLRGYVQSAASFYEAHYDGEPRYRTRDRTLGAMRSVYGAVTLDAPIGSWHVVGSAGLLRLWFLDFVPQHDRNAALVFSSVSKSW